MGKWYCNLQKKYRVLILISIWILSLLMLILASVLTDEDGNPNGVCSLLWLIALVFAICLSVLFIKASKQEASSKKNDTGLQANLEVVPAELKDDQIQARGEEKRKMVIDSTKTSKIQTEGYSNPSEFIALDLETPNTNNDSVSSISFVHVRDGEVIHKVSELLNPEQDFAAVNTQITGINSLMVKEKRKFPDFWREYGKEITSFPIVGHNVRFDIVVICKCLKHYGFMLNEVQYIDTMEMARDYLVLGNFGLDSVCQALNIPLAHHHNSLDDAMASEQIYSSLIESKTGSVAYIHVFDGDNSIRSHKSSFFKYSKQTEAYQFLKNMTDEILADNRITLKEIHKLDEWLDANEEFLAFYPFDRINASVKKALADNQISEEETQDLLQLFREIEEPLEKSEEPEIIVSGKLFCLTGDFVKGKEAVSEELLAKGAMVKDTLTMKVNYLVVGSKGSEAWKYGNYGGKVAKAKEYNAKGKDIKIVSEKALTEALSKIS